MTYWRESKIGLLNILTCPDNMKFWPVYISIQILNDIHIIYGGDQA
jgi:hypothetical protein